MKAKCIKCGYSYKRNCPPFCKKCGGNVILDDSNPSEALSDANCDSAEGDGK